MTELVQIEQSEWPKRRRSLIEDYASQSAAAGRASRDVALEDARREFDSLLPEGPETEGHYLYSVEDGGEVVGFVWIFLRRDRDHGALESSVWIYDLVIEERFRRRGYARQALRLVRARARDFGASSVGLHVFGNNRVARRLYEDFGFETMSVVMRLPLDKEG